MEKTIQDYINVLQEELRYYTAAKSVDLPTKATEKSLKKTANELAEFVNENF